MHNIHDDESLILFHFQKKNLQSKTWKICITHTNELNSSFKFYGIWSIIPWNYIKLMPSIAFHSRFKFKRYLCSFYGFRKLHILWGKYFLEQIAEIVCSVKYSINYLHSVGFEKLESLHENQVKSASRLMSQK